MSEETSTGQVAVDLVRLALEAETGPGLRSGVGRALMHANRDQRRQITTHLAFIAACLARRVPDVQLGELLTELDELADMSPVERDALRVLVDEMKRLTNES